MSQYIKRSAARWDLLRLQSTFVPRTILDHFHMEQALDFSVDTDPDISMGVLCSQGGPSVRRTVFA